MQAAWPAALSLAQASRGLSGPVEMTNSVAGVAAAFVVVAAGPSVEVAAGAGNAGILSLATGVLGSTLGAGRCTNKGITCCGMVGGSAAGDAGDISLI